MLAFLGMLSFFVSIGGLITGGLWAWKKKPKAKKLLITSAIVFVASLLLIGITAEKPEETTPEDTRTKTTPSPSTTLETTPQASETPSEGPSETSSEESPTPATETAAGSDALQALQALAVKGRAPKTGYDRDEFGAAWSDVDHNGCDTRNDILTRDLTNITYKSGTKNCVVASGTLQDPYTGKTINFVRGQDTSSAVQIDHVVALSDAWQKGAQQLSSEQRRQFANDPLNLLAADGPANGQKGDGDAATWLPSNKTFRCDYVARQVAVKHKYGLWVTEAEKNAIERVLQDCPGQVLPDPGAPVVVVQEQQPPQEPAAPQAPTATTTPAPETPATNQNTTATDPNFGTCKEAKKHGNTPYVKGVNPEYDFYRDGDGDGVVCE